MPTTIDLDTLPVDKDYRQPLTDEPGVGAADYGRAAAAGAYGVVGSAAAGVDYLIDSEDDSALKGVRRFANEGTKAQIRQMTPAARDALNAGFLPGGDTSIWSPDVSIANSLGLKVANASPSLLASVLPGGLVAGAARGIASRTAAAAAGTATSGAINASMMAGQVYDDIEKAILDAKEDYLQANSPLYAKLRGDGFSDTVARKVLTETAAGNKPLLAGAVGAIAEQFGASALAARRAVGEAGEGVLRGARRGAVEEGVTEAGQGAAQEALTQQGQIEAGTQNGFDWRKILEQTVQGATVGGILGGAVGGVTGLGPRRQAADATQDTTAEPDAVIDAPAAPAPEPRPPARAPIDPVVAEAAGGTRSRQSLEAADAALGALEDLRRETVDPAVEAAVNGTKPVAPRSNSEFTPTDDFEVDPDFEPEVAPQAPQQPAQAAPGQALGPSELPAQPAESVPAGGPSEAMETAIAEPQVSGPPRVVQTIDLDTNDFQPPALPDEPVPPILQRIEEREQGPRVLRPVNEPAQPRAPRVDQRISRSERERIAKGEGDAVALSSDPADWNKQSDRVRVKKLAEIVVKERGEDAPQWARDVIDALGQRRTGQGPAAKAAREKYLAARQALADEVQGRVQEGVARRETKDEARDRQAQEKRVLDSRRVSEIVQASAMPTAAQRGLPKAVRAFAADVVSKARAAGVTTQGVTDDAHLLYLRTAEEVARSGSSVEQIQQFITDDFFLRNGEGGQIRARRQSERIGREQSYDENARASAEIREGADAAEAYDAAGAVIEPAADTAEIEALRGDEPSGAVAQPAPERVQDGADTAVPEPAEVVPGTTEAVVAGQDRAGRFKVESRAKRRVREVADRKAVRQPDNRPIELKEPTEAQKAAGNYPMKHVRALGLDVSVETTKGQTRSGTDPSGRRWSVEMPADYGYIRGTKGVDGDHVDVYLGPKVDDARYRVRGEVFVVNQQNLDGTFDEHKVLIGFPSYEDAIRTYKAGFSDRKGAQRIQSVARFSQDEFKDWLAGNIKGPAQDPSMRFERSIRAMDAPAPLRSRPLPRQAETDAAEIARLLGDEPEVATGPMLVSPRSGAQARILSTGKLGDYLKGLNHKAVGGVAAQVNPFIARRLRELVPDISVHVVSDEGMRSLTAELVGKGGFPGEIDGYYDPVTNEIVLKDMNISEERLSHLVIHEGLHAAFMRTIERNPEAKKLIRQLMDTVRAKLLNPDQEYGLTNEHEFVSEAMSNRDFQEKLAGVPVSTSYGGLPVSNIWQYFISGVRKFLGMKPVQSSALDAALRIGAVLTDLRTASNLPSTPRTPFAMPAALGSQTIRDGLGDVGGAFRGGVTAKVLRVRTLDQIRQYAIQRNLFPDGRGGSHADNLVKKVQRWQNYVTEKRRAADVHVQDFENLKRADPKLAQRFALLANDVTMANLNLLKGRPSTQEMQAANRHVYGENPDKSDIAAAWQSKAQHADLQKQFSALPEAQQEQFLRAAKYYRETQNEKARTFTESILDQLAPEITGDARADLITKTLSGRLTEEDRATLSNNTLFDALKSAPEFKSIKGMYFPLMRQGDYVVRTRDIIRDTMGGTEVEPGVLEFTGSDKEARKAADAFARKTDLTVTRIAKRYYDTQTGEAIKAVDADKDSRVGYRVSVQLKGLHMFDSRTKAERFVREARRDGAFHAVEDWQHREGMEQRGDLSYSQLSALVRSVETRDDLTPGQRQVLKTVMAQAATRLMSGNRIQHRSLPRKMVQGAGDDFSRNMLGYATAESNFLGKLHYMPGIRDDLKAMEEQAKAFNADKSQIRKMVFEEVQARVDSNDVGLNQPSAIVRDLFAVTMLGKLASPAYSIINAAQPIMTTLPVLGGTHGNVSAAAELSRAFRDIGAWRSYGEGVSNTYTAARRWGDTALDTTDVVGSIKKRLGRSQDAPALRRMLDDLAERGALGDSAQFELASAIAGGRGVAGTALAKMDRIFRQAPAAVEAVNRAGAAVAAYRLARRKGQSEQQASDYAFDVVANTQFDYASYNAPPVFNNPVLRPFLQFKKYGQAMTDLYAGMIYQAFKGESKADRRVAMKQFGNLVAVHALMAGAFGIPGLELVKVGFILSAAFGLGGAGWQDQERRIRRAVEEAAGKTWAGVVTDGAVGRVLGVDLSNRLSAADMWTYGEPRKYKSSEITQWIAESYFGASGGTIRDWREGVLAAQDADYLKAAQKIVPVKVLADTAKALNAYSDDKMSAGEAATQALGFKPARIADQQQARSDVILERAKIKDERDTLRNKYLNAGSAGSRAKIKVQILQYNRTAEPRMKLSIPGLDKMREADRLRGLQ